MAFVKFKSILGFGMNMFFSYFYDNHVDTGALFESRYSYYDYMNSYSNPDTLRNGMNYMLDKVQELEQGQSDASDVERAKTFIIENIADQITVKEVAEHVSLSAEYFTKLFKKETGQNIKEYITLTKIQVAKDMLNNPKLSIGMVAIELGYSNFSHFSQVFKKYEGVTPSEYRAQMIVVSGPLARRRGGLHLHERRQGSGSQ